jgi:hypothetical protein
VTAAVTPVPIRTAATTRFRGNRFVHFGKTSDISAFLNRRHFPVPRAHGSSPGAAGVKNDPLLPRICPGKPAAEGELKMERVTAATKTPAPTTNSYLRNFRPARKRVCALFHELGKSNLYH